MLNTDELQPNSKCFHKGKELIFQQRKTASGKDFFVFIDNTGKEKKLSKNETQKQVWIEILGE